MLCEKILGRLSDFSTEGKSIEYVEIEWHEAFKKIHKKVTDQGTEVGIRLDDSVLTRGLYEGDVLYADNEKIVAVHTPPCDVIYIAVRPDHLFMTAKVCYEIGNRHAPLFYGEEENTFITPYNEPMIAMLSKMHGICVERKTMTLDFDRRISAAIHNHHH
ncbi:urease accessory protein [Catenibacillus scindens]|uniref:Urease accessory protein UreE n=1 Tax=Catenibacillus scindens TaxID=673271 RepID=A0A7W8HCL0_9FIRM|nr:urease accessory protein UreE [Catenibacillus scindens]MBB5265888.1 urease accessory protein [Catenibacillus scindens]